ncbi:IS30 family transposase [Georgenia thermotolerans]|uniref:IS30 family transposase n=1 Tax=Georgenia thermotolerans TaxID=527326 RepID=UPI001479336B|nr:IS30 family transposase [Georgenia thermotolerans]
MCPLILGEPTGRRLSVHERDDIAVRRAASEGARQIARALGRSPSTISRRLARNRAARHPHPYRAHLAQAKADERARRPKAAKLATNPALRAYVEAKLRQGWSPQQIARRLRTDFPDDESMRISYEAIYQSVFVQGRGALRKDLHTCLRTGRAARRPRGRRPTAQRGQIPDMVLISDRP